VSAGLGLNWSPAENLTIGYVNQISNESGPTDDVDRTRLHNNLWMNISWKKLDLQFGGDFVVQGNSKIDGEGSAIEVAALASAKYEAFKGFSVFGRFEYLDDKHGIISGLFEDINGYMRGLSIVGYTLGAEFKPSENSYIRVERRQLITIQSSDLDIFTNYWKDDAPIANKRNEWVFTLGIELDFFD
jgi:hypothetical protein